jgi:protein TonB
MLPIASCRHQTLRNTFPCHAWEPSQARGVYFVMFEQSLLQSVSHAAKARALALSLTTQAAAVVALLMIPLIYTDRLPWGHIVLPATLTIAPQPPPPTDEKPATRPHRPAHPIFGGFFVPIHIPKLNATPEFIDAPADTGPLIFDGVPPIPVARMPFVVTEGPPPPEVEPVAVDEPAPKPVAIGGNVLAAKLLRRVLPVYPIAAKIARVSGTVHLLGVVSKEGTIQQLQVISGNPLLIQAAMEAVKQWVYSPTLLNGKPVEVSAPIDVIFSLSQQ